MHVKNTFSKLALGGAGLLLAASAAATTSNPRITWDSAPDSNVIVSFAATGSQPYILYGTSTTESAWQRKDVSRAFTFDSTLVSQFVYLNNLQANTAYYFRACDSNGCGAPHWFKTASASPQNFTFISGGDSRTNRGERQQGNRLAAKIRPAFVYFGGDLTDNNVASQMNEWLSDWQLSFASDTINGVSYKYIPGLILNVGNHEANDLLFLCKVFGMDMDRSNSCSMRDTYGAFNINGNQLRVYNLNSELSFSGSDFVTQTNWMKSDLANQGAQAQWRMASYHRPALPRTSAKPSVNSGLFAWAVPFYDYKMNVVFESDSHLLKITEPVKAAASGNDYQTVTAGTIYLGEGAWGAPKRSADRNASWLIDLVSVSHFNILQFSGNNVLVRTALLSGEAGTAALTRDARDSDPLALPAGLQLRNSTGTGEIYSLTRDAAGRTIKVGSGSNQAPVVNAGSDVQINTGQAANLNGSASDDGLPSGSSLSVQWSKVSGPGTVQFGASTQATTTASFSAAGVYVLRLSASDGALGSNDDVSVTVSSTQNTPPVANFSFTAQELNVTFTNSSTDSDGSISQQQWNFGDNTTSSQQHPVHSYAQAGTYTVTLTVTDNGGASNSYSQSVIVTSSDNSANEVEPNNSFDTSQLLPQTGRKIAATIGSSSDEDYFRLDLPAGKTIVISLQGNSASDYDLYLYNSNKQQIAKSERSAGEIDTIESRNTGTSTFARYIVVKRYSGNTGSSGTYNLDVSVR